jgi:DNA repair photolyase
MPGKRTGTHKTGRGAVNNPAGRFELRPVEFDAEEPAFADEDPLEPLPPLETVVTPESPRTILATNDSPDIPFSVSINPYKGCEHGCVYCFARPSHSFLGLSPGLDFETKIFSKPTAPALLRKELSRPGYACEVIALGANTDPYQPVERRLGITRALLEVMAEFRQPVSIVTKSNLVLRDLDILGPMAAEGLANAYLSITTLDPALARSMEPRAATPAKRLETLRGLSEAGVPCGVLASPMIPGLNDSELERILEAAARAGAKSGNFLLVRLPHEVKEIVSAWLEEKYPLKAKHVLSLIRQSRDGRLNDPNFGSRMRGTGPYAEMLSQRLHTARARFGLADRLPSMDFTKFRVPGRRTLFDDL